MSRVLAGLHEVFDDHAQTCGDRVVGIALSNEDFEELRVAEIWGLPVLGWDEVQTGRVKLLCERDGVLIPPMETFEDVVDRWTYHLEREGRTPSKTGGQAPGELDDAA